MKVQLTTAMLLSAALPRLRAMAATDGEAGGISYPDGGWTGEVIQVYPSIMPWSATEGNAEEPTPLMVPPFDIAADVPSAAPVAEEKAQQGWVPAPHAAPEHAAPTKKKPTAAANDGGDNGGDKGDATQAGDVPTAAPTRHKQQRTLEPTRKSGNAAAGAASDAPSLVPSDTPSDSPSRAPAAPGKDDAPVGADFWIGGVGGGDGNGDAAANGDAELGGGDGGGAELGNVETSSDAPSLVPSTVPHLAVAGSSDFPSLTPSLVPSSLLSGDLGGALSDIPSIAPSVVDDAPVKADFWIGNESNGTAGNGDAALAGEEIASDAPSLTPSDAPSDAPSVAPSVAPSLAPSAAVEPADEEAPAGGDNWREKKAEAQAKPSDATPPADGQAKDTKDKQN